MSRKRKKTDNVLDGASRAWGRRVARESGAVVREMIPPEGKISDTLYEYAEPLIEQFVETEEDQISAVKLACILWNMSFMRKEDAASYSEMESVVMSMLSLPPYYLAPDGALNLISFMLRRRDNEFSWCSRIIMDSRIERKGNGLHLSVISTPFAAAARNESTDHAGREQPSADSEATSDGS